MSTKAEFAGVMAYLAAAVAKELPEAAVAVYWDLLGDLPATQLLLAAKQVVLEHRYATFPSVAALREAAARSQAGQTPSAAEAWRDVRRAIARFGFARREAALASLPPAVAHAVECFGWRSLCDSTEPEITRAQFLKMYETVAARERRHALMPPEVRQLEASVVKALPAPEDSHA